MDKVILVTEKVEDLYGLYIDLRRAEFAVKNVGADQRGTYVYVDEYEAKDPLPIVKSWVGKAAPEMSVSLKKKRLKEYGDILEHEKKVAEEKRLAAEEETKKAAVHSDPGAELIGGDILSSPDASAGPVEIKDDSGNVIGELMQGVPGDKESLFKRIWKKLF